MQYDEDFLRELNQKVNLADYVGNFIELSPRSNGDLYGKCPLHDDKTPSFSVNDNYFYEYKANGKDLKKNGVTIYARFFADTYEEAVEGFNKLVKTRIESLKDEISKLEDMLIV